jgi:hypothetical protein
MTRTQSLETPWSLHFDRDGTEDFGIICDAGGNDLVASFLPGTRIADKTFETGTFWLPEYDHEPIPVRVRQMRVMTAAPKLLAMLKIAVATAGTAKQRWVKEAREAIAEATGQEYGHKEAEAARHLHRAAPQLYAALETCEAMLRDYLELARVVDARLGPRAEGGTNEIETARREAFAALCEARGERAF